MTKSLLILTVLGAVLFTPSSALAKSKNKHRHDDDRSCEHESRRYYNYDGYRSGYSAPRYYSPSQGQGYYPRDCDRRDYGYRQRSGFSFFFN